MLTKTEAEAEAVEAEAHALRKACGGASRLTATSRLTASEAIWQGKHHHHKKSILLYALMACCRPALRLVLA